MSAWGLAFMLPNLFRRLFGEGAIGTSMVPIVSYSLEREGKNELRKKLGAIFLALSIILLLLCVIFSIIAVICEPFATAERVKLALRLVPLLLPYAIFICLVGVMSSALNCVGKFFLPALGTLSLNIIMILCLIFVCPKFSEKTSMLKSLGVAVVISGFIQLIFTAILLKFAGIFPSLRISQFWKNPVLKELWELTLPGIIGASALQISFVADRSMACWLGDYAVPALNYSDRIIDLPIGIFAVAMTTVIAPGLARSAAKKDHDTHREQFLSSLKTMFFLSIPVAVFIFLFKTPITRLFYMRGAFGEKELAETTLAMTFYCIGIPFFCSIKIIASAFHSMKDMKTPVKISLLCIVLNIILNFIFMFKFKQGGIALATVISSLANCLILLRILQGRNKSTSFHDLFVEFTRISASALLSIAVVAIYSNKIFYKLSISMRFIPTDLIPLIVLGILFSILFLSISHLFGSKTPREILNAIKSVWIIKN